jgi:hypothetical protein
VGLKPGNQIIRLLLLGMFLSNCGRGSGFDIQVKNSELYMDQNPQKSQTDENLSKDTSSQTTAKSKEQNEDIDRKKPVDPYQPKTKLNWGLNLQLLCLIDQYSNANIFVYCGFTSRDSNNFVFILEGINIDWNINSRARQQYPVSFDQRKNIFRFNIPPHEVETTTIKYLISNPLHEGTVLGKVELSSFIEIPDAH